MKQEKNHLTKIRLYKDNDRYRQDVLVAVNGKTYLIRRGVEVEVPDEVAEVLENARCQTQAAIDAGQAIGSHS